ncbi:hypothetical protein HYV49_01995 [Candidatus Pacearchaeota archaeon]|nr:hypothetical protein [Candidatus Pacearchaeota archaeon]
MIIPEEKIQDKNEVMENKEVVSTVKDNKSMADKLITGFIIFVFIVAISALFYASKSLFLAQKITGAASNPMAGRMSRMSLTPFDIELAKQFMDKDNDGKCDACGMPVEQCIDSGQMQCNMDSKSTIGILGSEHIHADIKVYVNGNTINFANEKYYMKSSFLHLDDNLNKEDASSVLHMHATGVPLWILFDSIELEFPQGIRAYVNGKEISDYRNYVFNDLDKILITDGNGSLEQQLNSITDFAKDH